MINLDTIHGYIDDQGVIRDALTPKEYRFMRWYIIELTGRCFNCGEECNHTETGAKMDFGVCRCCVDDDVR